MHARFRFALITVLLLSAPSLAAAQGWGRGWIEQWSGQGGFIGHEVTVTPFCEQKSTGAQGPIVFLGKGDHPETLWCVDLGLSFYDNRESDRAANGKVSFQLYQAVAMASPLASGAVEVGAGAGFGHFTGDKFDSFNRFYVPTRFSFKPFRLGRANRNVQWTGIIQLVGNLHVYPLGITDEDTNFKDHSYEHHFQGNLILFFDFSQLIFKR